MTVKIQLTLEQMQALCLQTLDKEGIPVRGKGWILYRGDRYDAYGMEVELDPLLIDGDTSAAIATLKGRVPIDTD